jgi:SAM-dependent methyltransferase
MPDCATAQRTTGVSLRNLLYRIAHPRVRDWLRPRSRENLKKTMRILDVGCGINKFAGSIGIDVNPRSRADVLCQLNHFPYPFRDSSFDSVRAIHVIEHVADVVLTIEEFHRLARPGGTIVIVTPHYTDFSSFCDPTHRWHLNSFSLRYFGEDNAGYGYYSTARLEESSVRVRLLSLWKWLGFEFLVNHSRRFRRFWEFYLCYVIRGKVIEWELKVLKTS